MIIEHLNVSLADGTKVANVWTRQLDAEALAIVLPGGGYTVLGPLLYYPRLWAMEQQIDTLSVDYRFLGTMSADEVIDHAVESAISVFDTMSANHQYGRFMLIGKSLGTRVMARLLEQRPIFRNAPCVWLTPIFADNALMDAIDRYRPRSLFIAGTDDPSYDEERLKTAVEATGGQLLLVEGANHSLELKNDVRASLAVIPRLLDALDQLQRRSEG